MRFAEKTVLISGAASGFGQATARAFADEGANLVLTDINAAGLDRVAASLARPAVSLAGNVTEPEFHVDLVNRSISEFGGLDIAINNAGIVHDLMRIDDTPLAEAERVFDIDLKAMFYALRSQIPAMRAEAASTGQTKSIVNIASAAGRMGSPFLGVYSAAKHGVVGLTRAAALENARAGLRVNAVCPSFCETPMLEIGDAAQTAERTAKFAHAIPMGRLGQVEEVVVAILFAADPANSFMTGELLSVDGGLFAG